MIRIKINLFKENNLIIIYMINIISECNTILYVIQNYLNKILRKNDLFISHKKYKYT